MSGRCGDGMILDISLENQTEVFDTSFTEHSQTTPSDFNETSQVIDSELSGNTQVFETELNDNVKYFDSEFGEIYEVGKSPEDSNDVNLDGYAKSEDIPTKVSQLENDSGYITEHQDLSEYAKKTELPKIPDKVSAFENDVGYLTEHQSLDNYYTKPEVTEELNKKQDTLDKYVESVNGYSGEVTLSASDVKALPDTTVIPTVPNVVSAFTNDADYASRTYVAEVAAGKCKAYTFETVAELDEWLKVTDNTADLNNGDVFYIRAVGVPDYWWDKETQSKQILETTKVDLTDYAKSADIPLNVSQLNNDAKYTTESEVDTKLGGKQDKLSQYVSSVNGKSGAVSLNCSDVGAMPSDTQIPTALSQLNQDASHRVVTDTEKATWNAKSNFSGNYNDLSNKPTILSAANKGYNGAITAGTDGVAEMGKYIDFHNTSSGTSDYSTRFVCTGDHQNAVNLPSVAGTLVVADRALLVKITSSAPSTNDTSVITVVI